MVQGVVQQATVPVTEEGKGWKVQDNKRTGARVRSTLYVHRYSTYGAGWQKGLQGPLHSASDTYGLGR